MEDKANDKSNGKSNEKSNDQSNDKSKQKCVVCSARENLKICARCSSTYYCCKEHQVSDWKRHKPSCVQMSKSTTVQSKLNGKDNLEGKVVQNISSISLNHEVKGGHIMPDNNHSISPVTSDLLNSKDCPSHITSIKLQKQAKDVVICLHRYGISLINNFLGAQISDKILEEVQTLNADGKMHDGQTTQQLGPGEQQQYRSDKIAWVPGNDSQYKFITLLVTIIDALIKNVQNDITEYDIQGRTQAMVACYPGSGSHYVRHVDNPNHDGRVLTCIYYLNRDWNCQEHGGMLKIYPEGTTRVASIEPLMDRLLIFWSDKRNPHEVLPAFRTRYAVTVWYFDANERSRATNS